MVVVDMADHQESIGSDVVDPARDLRF